ncbi:MAG: S8 family serine peptidase, partial [Bacillota bacterium]
MFCSQSVRPGKFRSSPGLRAVILSAVILIAAGFAAGLISCVRFQPDAPEATEVTFLNDRAASVIGAMPLAAPGFVRPEGLTGAGQVVAIADSGLGNGRMDDPHPDLKSRPGQMPKVIMLKSWAGRETADDPDGHGTHLAATVAGTGAASDGQFAGVAPGASIYFQA